MRFTARRGNTAILGVLQVFATRQGAAFAKNAFLVFAQVTLVVHKVRFAILMPRQRIPAQGGGLSKALCLAIDDNAAMGCAGR